MTKDFSQARVSYERGALDIDSVDADPLTR